MTGLTSPEAFRMQPHAIPQTVAGRMEWIREMLAGVPIVTVCECGCGLETDMGRREPLITVKDAARLMEGM